jgi:rfaE bifunctional protein kinase chain/domain
MNNSNTKLCNVIAGFTNKKIAVWGDIILDEYLYGNTRRISREAPVLILSYKNKEFSLGGGGNALLNLKDLGAEPIPIGVIGSDPDGEKITQLLKKHKISSEFIFNEKGFSTPKKTRILAGEENTRKQQILRIDKEGKIPKDAAVYEKILPALNSLAKQVDALLISDYHNLTVIPKLFQQILPEFKESGIPVTLDSRFRLLEFKGTTVSTPNEPEVELALNLEMCDEPEFINNTGKLLLKQSESEAILLTRGAKGMVLFEQGQPSYAIPVHGTTDIVDVTGAGDTVISVFTLALAAGATFQEAAELANYAGGIVVMKKGTATLSSQELKEAILS